MRRSTTLADIARLAGVSTSAVSLALNGRVGVSDDTRARIVEIAENLGWHPNAPARALTGRPVAAVGIVLRRPARFLGAEPFYMSFLAGLENQFSKLGSSLLMHIAESPAEEIATIRRWAAERRVDGLVLLDLRVNDERLDVIKYLELPTVVVGDPAHAAGLPAVWTADADAVRAAVHRLSQLGHERLAWVGERSDLAQTRIRTDAFIEACASAGLPTPRILETDSSSASGREATTALLSHARRPTAILFDNDLMAVAALGAARDAGLDVPADVSLVAYDDSILCEVTSPPLSALSHDVHSYGAHVAQLLLREVQAAGSTTSELDATPEFVERGSTGPAPA
ncbi:LacI family DNA-binding transcriptional regulator [Auraticoccus monumenti]|uniref:LacI family DNA-binding transcriptional regulator n=1 Tax=Auraticoccus monumenti TaxID=675864 RepID=UPI001561ADCF|nr:LacI family DNA-binding transcriptional regulator [Auraticoccus monumenti]